MENKAHALAAGIFVIVVSAMLIAMAAWLTRDSGEHRIYEISSPQAINGLQSQAAVRYKGVAVGKVTEIGFDPKAVGNVLVRIALSESAPITAATFATLGFQGVTGLAFVQLDDAGDNKTPLVTSEAAPARIPMRASLLSKLSDQGVAILERLEQTSERVNQLLAPANQQQLMATIAGFGQAAASVQTMSGQVQKLSANMDAILNAQLGPQRVDIPRFVGDATAALKTLQATAGGIDQTVAEFKTTATAFTALADRLNAKGGAVERLTEGAAALTQGAVVLTEAGLAFNSGTLPRLNRTSDETTRAVRQVNRAVSAVSDNPQLLIFGNGPIRPGPGEPGFSAAKGKP
jgi:phospholipid/cholesterol/gamma-HCH transport system substrate-binding protein